MVTEIIAILIDIGLGALAYKLARQAAVDIADLRTQVAAIRKRVDVLETQD